MAAIRLTQFKGIAPRVAPRLLAPENAQVAANCSLTSGELRPLVRPETEFTPGAGANIESFYDADGVWLSWDRDVDVARSPLPGEARFIYTGDGEPRITTTALAYGTAGGQYPEAARPLGVPSPMAKPTVTPAGAGTGETITRYYLYTFYDDWNQESGASPVSDAATSYSDDYWAISGMDTAPANSGTGTASHVAGVTTFTMAASAKHWLRAGDQIIFDTSGDTVAVRSVTSTTVFTVAGDYSAETDWDRVAPWGTVTKRIYRTSGSTGEFRLVIGGLSSATTSYTDSLSDLEILGDDLVSSDWALPPTDLKGVVTLPSGALAGFSGNEICFSEPFQPQAWPTAYRMRSPWAIVSLQYYSSGLVAGTVGNPFQIIGLDPGQMAAQPVNGVYPCISKRSTVSLVDSVGFATEEGFVSIGDGGVNVISKDWFSRNEWDAYDPTTMEAAYTRGRIYIMSRTTEGNQLLIFDFLDGTGLTVAYVDPTSLFANPVSGKLFYADGTVFSIKEFDPVEGVYMQQDWKSRVIVLPKPLNIAAAKLNFSSRITESEQAALTAQRTADIAANAAIIAAGNVLGSLNSRAIGLNHVNGSLVQPVTDDTAETAGVNFRLYTEDQNTPIFTKLVTDEKPFKLPSGYKSDKVSVRVTGEVLIKSIEIGESIAGLGAV